jgi:hypothetical protein
MRNFQGSLHSCDVLPLVGRLGVTNLPICQPIQAWTPPLGVAGATALSNFDET